MIGAVLAQREGVHAGDSLRVSTQYGSRELRVVGIFDAGGDEDEEIYAPMELVQALTNTDGLLTSIEVSALTTPDRVNQ